jgi:glucose-6-phosphate 1-dehydrogenase
VNPESVTPTFAMMRLFIDNWRWQGVPFYLVSGKRLARKETKIVVQFKNVPHSMFREVLNERITANRLELGIYPDEKISLTFQTKVPGVKSCLRLVTMDFKYYQGFQGPPLDAYAKVLLDVILGDHMLFWRQDSVELSWSYLTPILHECETCPNPEARLHSYEAGSWGPQEALKWMSLIVE